MEAILVPRPFPPPAFDRLQYEKTEGEGLGERVTCMTSGRHEGAVPDEGSCDPSCSIYLVQKLETVTFERQCQYSSLFGRFEADQPESLSYNDRAPPPSCLPDVMHVTLSPKPSPSVFAYCKRSKAWGGNGLETRLHGSGKVAKNGKGLGTESSNRRTRTCMYGSLGWKLNIILLYSDRISAFKVL